MGRVSALVALGCMLAVTAAEMCPDSPPQLCKRLCGDPGCAADECAMRQGTCCEMTCKAKNPAPFEMCPDSPLQLCRMQCQDPGCAPDECAMREGPCCEMTCKAKKDPDSPTVCCDDMTAKCLSCKDDTDLDEYCAENPHTKGCKGACCREKVKNGMSAGLNCMACFKGETTAEFCEHLLGKTTSAAWWQDIQTWLSAKTSREKKLIKKCEQLKCATAMCTMDLCSDGKGRRQIGDDCCACPPKDCSTTPCTKDLCWDGLGRRQIGDDCCACPDQCATVRCAGDLCPDGLHRRKIGDDCCACPPKDCSTVACTRDLCWDGLGRRQIGDDCCACPKDCRTTPCTRDLCWDGLGRRQIGNDCCACPERVNARGQLDVTVAAGGESATAVKVRAHDNNAPVECDMSKLSMGSVATNVILAVVIVILAVVVCRGRQDQISAEVEREPTGSSPSSSPTAKMQPSPVV